MSRELCRYCRGAGEIMNDSGFTDCTACGGSGFERLASIRPVKGSRNSNRRAMNAALKAMDRAFGKGIA